MAGTATLTKTLWITGPGGKIVELGTIAYDSGTTIEVPTKLTSVWGAVFTRIGAGSLTSTVLPSINETLLSNGAIASPSTKALTVETPGTTVAKFFYQLIGE